MSTAPALSEAESAILQAGLVELSRAKPGNAAWWLGMWLKENNPNAARAEGEERAEEPTYEVPKPAAEAPAE